MQQSNERGIALLTTMLVLMLISALLIGFTTVVMSDQRYRFIDRDRVQAFYAASGAMEKMTADLGNLFLKNVAPTNAQVLALTVTSAQPSIPGVSYVGASLPADQLVLPGSELTSVYCLNTVGPPAVNRAPLTVGTAGYTITFCGNSATNNPTTTAESTIIKSGAYEGLMALKTPYQLDVTARTATGGEVHLVRTIEAVAIPVFQFGIFSDVDLAFNAADDFSFGGRVHTNGNLYLSQGAGSTLTLSDKVTAVKEVVRKRLSNGNLIANNSDTGTVNMTKGGGAYAPLLDTQGSVVDGPTSGLNEPTWHGISLSTYKGYIRNGRTGVTQLNLPMINPNVGGTNTDLTRRPPTTEAVTSLLYGERLFTKASIRVLLSDTAADINNVPGIDTTVAPVSLEAGAIWGGIPIATSPGPDSATVSGNSGSSPAMVVKVSAIPPTYLMPTITATSGANNFTVTCTSKAPAQLSGCNVANVLPTLPTATIPNGATLQVSVGGTVVSTAASGNGTPVAVGGGKTIKVTSTAGFSPQTFWVDDYVITCSGYDNTAPLQFTGCAGPTPTTGHIVTTFAMSPKDTSTIGGFIKVERQNASDSTWHDITAEMLGYGIGAPSQSASTASPADCDVAATDPSPNAILRLQRLHDSGQVNSTTSNCTPKAGMSKYDYWPNTLFDTREAWQREVQPTGVNIKLGGVMTYIAIDAANLAKWFAHVAPYNTAGDTGNLSKTDNAGYSIYISDRRSNRDVNSKETAEYGWEDFVNPADSLGTPNGTLDAGEDLNANTTLETYGGKPSCNGGYNVTAFNGITCADATWGTFYNAALGPLSDIVSAAETNYDGNGRAMTNRPLLFRRAIKVIHGGALATWVTGFTVVTENPIYVQGDFNASGGFTGAHAGTAMIGDSVTILSSNWLDPVSFNGPYDATLRTKRTPNSYYRMAILAGKGALFPLPSGQPATFGTDGGAHSFVRMLEGNGTSPDTVHYKGSLATFYYSRQAVGIFKGNNNFVYGIPALRDYTFDTDFLTPALLPPLTPMFRDMNAVGFSQQLTPNK